MCQATLPCETHCSLYHNHDYTICISNYRQANSDSLVAIGLNLITVVLECGSSHLCTFPGLVSLVQDNLSKYLFQVREGGRMGGGGGGEGGMEGGGEGGRDEGRRGGRDGGRRGGRDGGRVPSLTWFP